MTSNPNGPWSFASPWGSGMMEAEVVNINSADNSVQVRIHGYQDDKGNIPDEGLQWVKCLGAHAGLQGASATHPYFVGSKVMLSMSGQQLFVVGSVTGYDSDKSNKNQDADNSDNTDPNTPRQVRGTKGPYNRDIPAGQGTDQTSKSTREVTKTDQPYSPEKPEKVYDYSKGTAPFEKGQTAKFTDLMSIGIQKLAQGSNVLDTIDQMDNNVSGAIQAGTKIIRNLENGGFGDAQSMMNAGGAMDSGTSQVADYHGNIQLFGLLAALTALLAAKILVDNASIDSTSEGLSTVPNSLVYQAFQVDQGIIDQVSGLVTTLDAIGTVALRQVAIDSLKSQFGLGFSQAVAASINYVNSVVQQAGTVAVLSTGTDPNTLLQTIQTLVSAASAAGMPASSVTSIGAGMVGQILSGGVPQIQQVLAQAQGVMQQIQGMMQNMNVFGGELNAMKEIMGGASSIQESLSNITMKFVQKRINLDAKGFTK